MHSKLKTWMIAIVFLSAACNDNEPTADKAAADQKTEDAKTLDTVVAPSLVTVGKDSILLLSAENGKPIGPDIKYMPEWKAYGWFTASDSVEWEVEVPFTGTYQAVLEWSVSDEEAGKEFLFYSGTHSISGKVAPSGSWETYKTAHIGTIPLPVGIQKMVFKSKTDFKKGAILDLRSVTLKPVK